MITAMLPSGTQPHSVLSPSGQMSEAMNEVWQRFNQHAVAVPVHYYWPQSYGSEANVLHNPELRILHEDVEFDNAFDHNVGAMFSPPAAYITDANFGSDMETGSPSTPGFPEITNESYHQLPSIIRGDQHLHPSMRYEPTLSAHSPHSSISGVSPRQSFTRLADKPQQQQRPQFSRSITAPAATEQLRGRRAGHSIATSGSPPIKRSGSDEEEEDDEYMPSEESKPRGRKRQRIPHTAVEKRYRENLNAHLDKLRQNVPSLANKNGRTGEGRSSGEGATAKPSKCEVLNGAIEHITSLTKENCALKIEAAALRTRLDDLERWIAATQRGQGPNVR